MSIAIIDCGGANLRSVQHAFQLKGYEANITTEKTKIGQASHIVIPGVGSAGMVMNALNSLQLTSSNQGTPAACIRYMHWHADSL